MDKHNGDNAIVRDSLYGTTPEPTYAGAVSFMRRKYSRNLENVDLVVTGVPLDTATTNRPGARFGPRAVRSASTIMSWERPYGMEFDPFDKLAVVDYGDCYFDFGRPESVPDEIEAHAASIIAQGAWLAVDRRRSFRQLSIVESACRKIRRTGFTVAFRCA